MELITIPWPDILQNNTDYSQVPQLTQKKLHLTKLKFTQILPLTIILSLILNAVIRMQVNEVFKQKFNLKFNLI